MTDLLELASKVEAGKGNQIITYILVALGVPSRWGTREHDVLGMTVPKIIADNSLDAAQAMHDAVLPGRDWQVRRVGTGDGNCFHECHIPRKKELGWHTGKASSPATAWFAAILRAVHNMKEDER